MHAGRGPTPERQALPGRSRPARRLTFGLLIHPGRHRIPRRPVHRQPSPLHAQLATTASRAASVPRGPAEATPPESAPRPTTASSYPPDRLQIPKPAPPSDTPIYHPPNENEENEHENQPHLILADQSNPTKSAHAVFSYPGGTTDRAFAASNRRNSSGKSGGPFVASTWTCA